jgi:tetratricopeptide (TPR) repeat protein
MDVHDAANETVAQAVREHQTGNYRGGLALVLPLLRGKAKEKLSPPQERDAVKCASDSYRLLLDCKAALPYAQRLVALEQQLHGPRSMEHADALHKLCMVHAGLKAFPAARKAITEAFAIMDELGLQQHEWYGSMLLTSGRLVYQQERYKEALVTYNRAKVVLVQYKQGNAYGTLLSDMAFCHQELHQWNEAVACYKEVVEHMRNLYGTSHPEYAASLNNLAALFTDLKQYEEAIPRLEEVLAIFHKVYGDQHESTVVVALHLAFVKLQAQQSHRGDIDVGHKQRMCSSCGTVKEMMDACNGCRRAWYCDAECQMQHWATHRPLCDVCQHCGTVLTKILRCSRCKRAKYCNAECSKAHWSQHKADCVATTTKK